MSDTSAQPVIPDELWMLWMPAGRWVLSVDRVPHGRTFLVAFDEDEATEAARHQNDLYELDCIPVRVK